MNAGESSAPESVLVPAIGGPATIACLRSLGGRGVDTIAVSERESVAGFHSAYCDEAIVVPDPAEDLLAYRDALVDLAARPDVRTIVPVREADVYVLSRYHEQFDPHVSLVVPTLDSLRTVHDRLLLARAAERAGVPIPATGTLDDVDEWTRDVIVKSRYNLLADAYLDDLGPSEVLEVSSNEHVPAGEEPDAEALRREFRHDPIVQEYVSGEEYMVGALYDRGEALAVLQHHQVRGMSYVGAGGVHRESVAIPELDAVARRLLDHLDWHGPACLEYVRDERTGAFKLAEINPRMWQSLAANVAMGADFPFYYWLQATGRGDLIDPEYDVGVGCHWLKGEFLYVLSLLRHDSPLVERPGLLATLRDIAVSIRDDPRFDYLTADDPIPFLQDWWALLCAVPGVPDVAFPGADATTWEGPPQRDRTSEPNVDRPPRVADGDGV